MVVSNEKDAGILKNWGLSNVSIILPGVDTSAIKKSRRKAGQGSFRLLMASAPWVENQFDLKGIDDLLETVAASGKLELTLLWRGLLRRNLSIRVNALGIAERVEIVDQHVNVSDYLENSHATVLLAKRGDIIKTFPHSLVESLAAGKPVILSDTIPMSDYVKAHKCGVVLDTINPVSIAAAVDSLKSNYAAISKNARSLDLGRFGKEQMVNSCLELYDQVNA